MIYKNKFLTKTLTYYFYSLQFQRIFQKINVPKYNLGQKFSNSLINSFIKKMYFPFLLLNFFLLLVTFEFVGVFSEFVDPMKHSFTIVTPKTFDKVINKNRNTDGVSVVLYFSSNEISNKKFIDNIYDKASISLSRFVRMTVLDCFRWLEFCKKEIDLKLGFPQVIVYPPYPIPPKKIDNTKNKIINESLSFIRSNNITMLNNKNFKEFVSKNPNIPKVLLFSKDSHPSILLKALSNTFLNIMYFGFITSEQNDLLTQYNISKFPTYILLLLNSKKKEIYKGEEEFDSLYKWLNVHAETFATGSDTGLDSESKLKEKPWRSEKIPELTYLSSNDICFKRSFLCAIYLTDAIPTKSVIETLSTLSELYPHNADRGPRFKWMWLNIIMEPSIAEFFKIDLNKNPLPSFIVFNPHNRLRFAKLSSDLVADYNTIKIFIENIVSGNGRFIYLKNKNMPKFSRQNKNSNDESKYTNQKKIGTKNYDAMTANEEI